MNSTYAFALVLLLATPALAAKNTCFVSLERPLEENASWKASCGSGPFTIAFGGVAANWLDVELVKCAPGGINPSTCPDPELPLMLPDPAFEKLALRKRVPPLPKCYPPGKPKFAAIGPLAFDRSCFRILELKRGHADLRSWQAKASKGVFPPPADRCEIDEFGEILSGDSSIPSIKGMVEEFVADYPSRGAHPRNAAEAIYKSYEDALGAVDGCIQAINPALAERLRQAMGQRPRKQKGPAGEDVVFRPQIECAEQLALRCESKRVDCAGLETELQPIYGKRATEDLRPSLGKLSSEEKCWPAHPDGKKLGSIEASNLVPGDVAAGSPKIKIFNPTATYARRSEGGPSTLLHEFLHAAGAKDDPNHNHGTQDNEPPMDQVYACQAIAFETFFERLSDDELRDACHLCAGIKPDHDPADEDACDFKKFGSAHAGLSKLGCRLK